MTKTKAVFFDLDETLIENRIPVPELFARMYSDFTTELGHDNKAAFFTELRAKASVLWATMFDTHRSPEEQFRDCFESCITATNAVPKIHRQSLAEDMLAHFLFLSSNNVRFQDNALEVLAELNNLGYQTGIITNGMERVQLGKIHKLEADKAVDHVIVSAQARAHKPNQPVFNLALNAAGVSANQACQIGDHPTNDVAGAIRAGMSGIFYNPKEKCINEAFAELEERPTHVIHSLRDVVSWVEQHSNG